MRTMSVDRGVIPDPKERPPSVDLVPGDIVVVWSHPETVGFQEDKNWWMGEVMFCECSAREENAPSIIHIADVDSGIIRSVNANVVEKVRMPSSWPNGIAKRT